MPTPAAPAQASPADHLVPSTWLHRLSALLAAATVALCLGFVRMDGDAAVYALLAKHMVQSGDWANLVFHGKDWLDKPHFPFWMVALSFKLFGVGVVAYPLPGLLFHLLGAWFTHRLAHRLLGQRVAALALPMYLVLAGSLLAVADQKAEVYLLGLMTGASYGWLRFAECWRAKGVGGGEGAGAWRWWLLGALCSGCALMTKGVFVLIVVGMGLLAWLWVAEGWRRLLTPRWLGAVLLALAGSALFTLPELVALHQQFDAQPDKLVFGRQGVSGVRFFLWDSQFGRFFNTGPIQNAAGSPFFFVHNLVWTFFPAVLALVAALWGAARQLMASWRPSGADNMPTERAALALLWGTFLTAFLLFSATRYQMDYYLVIAFPYAAIACAHVLLAAPEPARWLRALQGGYVGLGMVLGVVCAVVYAWNARYGWTLLALLPLAAGLLLRARWSTWQRRIAWATGASLTLFAFVVTFHQDLYERYNVGREIASYLNELPDPPPGPRRLPVLVNGMIFNSFDFLSERPTLQTQGDAELAQGVRKLAMGPDGRGAVQPFYLVVKQADADKVTAALRLTLGAQLSVVPSKTFDELDLPKQFVKQLLKDDGRLPRQTLVVLRAEGGGC